MLHSQRGLHTGYETLYYICLIWYRRWRGLVNSEPLPFPYHSHHKFCANTPTTNSHSQTYISLLISTPFPLALSLPLAVSDCCCAPHHSLAYLSCARGSQSQRFVIVVSTLFVSSYHKQVRVSLLHPTTLAIFHPFSISLLSSSSSSEHPSYSLPTHSLLHSLPLVKLSSLARPAVFNDDLRAIVHDANRIMIFFLAVFERPITMCNNTEQSNKSVNVQNQITH